MRSQDTVFVIAGVTGSVTGREMAWDFLKTRWSDLHDRYKGGFLLSRLIKVSPRLTRGSAHEWILLFGATQLTLSLLSSLL